jgi:predicted RNA polymerase sigma factor
MAVVIAPVVRPAAAASWPAVASPASSRSLFPASLRIGRCATEPNRLLDQNHALWDQLLIRHGLAALQPAEALGGSNGPCALHAAIAACHARARTAGNTDWKRIMLLYETLGVLAPSPIVALNHTVAVSMRSMPQPPSSWWTA